MDYRKGGRGEKSRKFLGFRYELVVEEMLFIYIGAIGRGYRKGFRV